MRATRRDFTIGSLLAAGTLGLPIMVKAQQGKTVALLFDSLVSPFWVSGLDIMREKAKANGWEVLENISNFDDNKQFEQVKAMIGRKVDGILIIQTDSKAVIPAIRAANQAGIPMVHFNRPPAESDAYSVAIQADNRKIAAETVQFLVDEAKKGGKKRQAVIMIGDLGDVNAIQRRADIDFLFTSSDFMLPQIQQVLETFDKWHKIGEDGHVLLGGFDGDANAYQLIADQYMDACGVQNLFLEVDMAFQAFQDMWAGKKPEKLLLDPGFVITQANKDQTRDQMWGFIVWTKNGGKP